MKNKKALFMFSGQGSQYYHMGKELFQKHRTFGEWMRKLDALAKEITGESVLDHLYSEKKSISNVFDRMLFTHPAIFMVEVALSQVMLETGIKPDVVLGSSLGEFAAAAVSGVMSPADLLELVLKQAEIIETHSQKGGMLTILHHQDLYHDNPLLYENSQLAAVNYSTHFVVSGTHEQLQEITGFLKQQNITFQLLPVSFAFHSSLIDAARAPYLDYLCNKQFQSPTVPYISCMEGKIIDKVPGDFFWQIARKSFFFPKALENLKPDEDYVFLDLGPSGTMANFVKNNRSNHSSCFTVMTPFGGELEKIKKLEKFFGLESYQIDCLLSIVNC